MSCIYLARRPAHLNAHRSLKSVDTPMPPNTRRKLRTATAEWLYLGEGACPPPGANWVQTGDGVDRSIAYVSELLDWSCPLRLEETNPPKRRRYRSPIAVMEQYSLGSGREPAIGTGFHSNVSVSKTHRSLSRRLLLALPPNAYIFWPRTALEWSHLLDNYIKLYSILLMVDRMVNWLQEGAIQLLGTIFSKSTKCINSLCLLFVQILGIYTNKCIFAC